MRTAEVPEENGRDPRTVSTHAPSGTPTAPGRTRYIDGGRRPVDALLPDARIALEERFDRTEILEVPGSTGLVVNDLRPERETGPPIVVVPGYYAEGDSFKQPMLDLALSGRRALTYNAYHGIDDDGLRRDHADKIRILQERDPQADIGPHLRKAAALIALVEAKGLTGVDVFGHSEGAIVATIAAYLRPELFRRKVFLNPAGMIGEPTMGEWGIYAGKALDDLSVVDQRVQTTIGNIARDTHTLANNLLGGMLGPATPHYPHPAYRGVSKRYGGDLRKEYASADSGHLRKEFYALIHRHLENWLPLIDPRSVVIGSSENDRLFPPTLVQRRARKAGVDQIFELRSVTHNVQHFEPGKVSRFILEALPPPAAEQRLAA